ncbi:MAG: putative thioredoxin reductase [Candidatus Saccharibacteria bacterium]|nr:putative thioredoxin reductase [Candidatus Saccharibacteria bacterium]
MSQTAEKTKAVPVTATASAKTVAIEPVHDVVMIGAGPAALSAAIYTTREDIETVLYDKGPIGGLAAVTDWIDNYPGFAKGISGLDLAENLHQQAQRFGAKFEYGEVANIIDAGSHKRVITTDGEVHAKAVLIATGSDYKKIGVPGEKEYYARGVHYCATCDGAFYRDKRLVVVGGGNSAVQEAIFLTRFASHIDILVRGDHFRASEVLQEELQKHTAKVTVHFNTSTDEIIGAKVDNFEKVTKVIGTDKTTGKKVDFPTDGVFVFVGLLPNTEFLKKTTIELDEIGFIKTNPYLETSLPGVFAAGDVRSGATMQIATAVGEGATAALMIRHYLEGHALLVTPVTLKV